MRLKNMFPVGLPDYAQWKEKGVVEKIDIESSDDESIEVSKILKSAMSIIAYKNTIVRLLLLFQIHRVGLRTRDLVLDRPNDHFRLEKSRP